MQPSAMTGRILFNLLQVLVVMVFSPLVFGVLNRLKEIVQSKRVPSILQPYRDLYKLFQKDEVISEQSSWVFRFAPYVIFVTPIFVALLIPVLTSYPLFLAFMGDMLGGGFVLALEVSSPPWRRSIRPIPTGRWGPAGRGWSVFWPSRCS